MPFTNRNPQAEVIDRGWSHCGANGRTELAPLQIEIIGAAVAANVVGECGGADLHVVHRIVHQPSLVVDDVELLGDVATGVEGSDHDHIRAIADEVIE